MILALVLAVMGFFMGTIDTVANVSMIRIYGKDVSPFLQALHFFYGVGAFVSPMIAQPFLLNEDCSPFIDSHVKPITDLTENETLPAQNLEEAQKMTHIDYAFWIMALLMVSSSRLLNFGNFQFVAQQTLFFKIAKAYFRTEYNPDSL